MAVGEQNDCSAEHEKVIHSELASGKPMEEFGAVPIPGVQIDVTRSVQSYDKQGGDPSSGLKKEDWRFRFPGHCELP
jgi:hypothetical protein